MRYLLVIGFLISFSLFGQKSRETEILVLGNYTEICLPDTNYTVTDSLPDDLNTFDVIMLFSSSTSPFDDSDIELITDFVEKGGGLYAGSDNWPLQSESNQITKRLYEKESYGEFEQKDAETAGVKGNLELEEMTNVPAGTTTVAFPLDYRLKVEAWVQDQPLILTGVIGKGRIIIDGGYSRFYCPIQSEESDQLFLKFISYLSSN